MSQPPNERQHSQGNPVGPLGAAFADLAADAPPTELSAWGVIDTAQRQSHRRHRWVLGTGVAAAAIAVTTLIGVSVSQSGSGSDASSAAVASSPASGGGHALVPTSARSSSGPAAPAPGDQGTGGGDAQSAPDAAPGEGGGTSGAAGGNCALPLTAAQQSTVRAALPGLAAAGCLPSTEALVAGTSFDGPAVTVTVTVREGDDPCPGDAPCGPINNHPGIFRMGLPSVPSATSGAPVRANSVTVVGAGGGRIVTVSAAPGTESGELPYSVDDLAVLVEELLAG